MATHPVSRFRRRQKPVNSRNGRAQTATTMTREVTFVNKLYNGKPLIKHIFDFDHSA
jgi:hypothetical protein